VRTFVAISLVLALAGLAQAQPIMGKRGGVRSAPRPTPYVDRTYSMVNRGGLFGRVARTFRQLRNKPLSVNVRVQSSEGLKPPERTLHKLAIAAGKMHERRGYSIGNLCRRVSVDLGRQIDRKIGGGQASLLYNSKLSDVSRSLMPKGWKRPVGYANHWVSYCTIGGLHYAVDGTARDYLNNRSTPKALKGAQGRLDAEIFVAGSSGELQTMLAKYYGGKPKAWVRQRNTNLHRLAHRKSRMGRWNRLPDFVHKRAFEAIPFSK
jgi:hypothetical protein